MALRLVGLLIISFGQQGVTPYGPGRSIARQFHIPLRHHEQSSSCAGISRGRREPQTGSGRCPVLKGMVARHFHSKFGGVKLCDAFMYFDISTGSESRSGNL
jgi:hypothetical protein